MELQKKMARSRFRASPGGPEDTRSRATSSSPAGFRGTCSCALRTPTCRGQAPANCGCVLEDGMACPPICTHSDTVALCLHTISHRKETTIKVWPRRPSPAPRFAGALQPLPRRFSAPLIRRLTVRATHPWTPDTELATEDLVAFGRSTSIDRVRFLWHGSGNVLFGTLTAPTSPHPTPSTHPERQSYPSVPLTASNRFMDAPDVGADEATTNFGDALLEGSTRLGKSLKRGVAELVTMGVAANRSG